MGDFKDVVAMHGYAILRDVPDDHIEACAEALGQIAIDISHPEKVRSINPQSIGHARPNTLSSLYGLNAFPFHTDCAHWAYPARYLILYCMKPGCGNRATLLIDTQKWLFTERQKNSLLNEIWSRAIKRPRLCTAAENTTHGLRFRFDEACMKPMTEGSQALWETIRQYINQSEKIIINWDARQLLVIDNGRMLHARGPSVVPDSDRVLKRVLIGGAQNGSVGFQTTMAEGKAIF